MEMKKNTTENTMQSDLDKKLDALRPGQSIKISGNEKCWCTAERTGDGRTLCFVRHTDAGFDVFMTCNF